MLRCILITLLFASTLLFAAPRAKALPLIWQQALQASQEGDVPAELYSFNTALPFFLQASGGERIGQEYYSPHPLLPTLKYKALMEVLKPPYKLEWVFYYNFYTSQREIIPPEFSDLPVDSDVVESFPTQAVIFFRAPSGAPLIVMVGDSFTVLYNLDHEREALEFNQAMTSWCDKNNFYRNKTLVYTLASPWDSYFEFLPGAKKEKLAWEDLILDPKLKQRVKFETEDLVRNFAKYEELGIPTKRGVLLVGPPGTGKTLISRVLMTQLRDQVTFLYITAKSVVSPHHVTEIYQIARLLSPCIVIMEDLDMIGGKDRNDQTQTAILNELLNQLDGLQGIRRLLTIGSSNDAKIIDPALLRPGRFDAHLTIGLPNYAARLAMLQLNTKSVILDASVNLETLANKTTGYSGAKLTDLVIRAKKFALRENSLAADGKLILTDKHFTMAFRELDRMIGGQ